jgi:hypothetical protein
VSIPIEKGKQVDLPDSKTDGKTSC